MSTLLHGGVTIIDAPPGLLVAKATLLLLGAWVGTLALARAAAAARHLVWLGGVIGLLVIPVFWVAPVRVAILPSGPEAVHEPEAPPAANATPFRPTPLAMRIVSSPHSANVLFAVWLTGAAGLVCWLMTGMLAVRRILGGSRELTSLEWATLLRLSADRLGLGEVPRLVASRRTRMAFACGMLRPTIALPEASEQWSEERRRAVLLHELAHLRRRDLLGHTLGRLACAVYWFHPLVWLAVRQLRAESERACDDLVLSAGTRPSAYAQQLLDLVMGARYVGVPGAALPMARPGELESRMIAILDATLTRATPRRAQALVLVGSAVVFAVALGAVVPVRRVATPAPETPIVVGSLPRMTSGRGATITDARLRFGGTTTPDAVRQRAMHAPTPTLPAATLPGISYVASADGDPRRLALGLAADQNRAVLNRLATEPVLPTVLMRSVYPSGMTPNPMATLLRQSDSLGITASQADSISVLNAWYTARVNGIWKADGDCLASLPMRCDAADAYGHLRSARGQAVDLLIAIAPKVRALLTPIQVRMLSDQVANYLDVRYLAAARMRVSAEDNFASLALGGSGLLAAGIGPPR